MKQRRIGIHLSTAGGVCKAAERAHEIGANAFQIFSSSPRMWRSSTLKAVDCERMSELRKKYDCSPLVIHTSYLVNLCSQSEIVRSQSIVASRGEVKRALTLGAEYLVLHPGSWRGLTREEGLRLAAESIERSLDGLNTQDCNFRILIENTAGAEFSLGSNFEQVAKLIHCLRGIARVGACLDTCHVHVAGYDIVSEEGYAETVRLIDATIEAKNIRVWHTNDAKAPRGSKLDRHEQIGQGTIGLETFRRLLNDRRFAHCAFIAEVPIEQPNDDRKNVTLLKSLVTNTAISGLSVK
ncbi:deoxyribonuclease IV [Alloacidobacterium sp.]|uniref:deoxyribonuclease IV n=1 Tax=Alloacidobacterium sp. TaxID=2951999 RepID=UPI002D26176A|nr:deoxyribonuclease IV [Alloacidobacterium sp.]HYK35974.1 deoxyribonuclease IV [Alloacidobacterium sp.]